MKTISSRSVRYAYVMFLLTLVAFAGLESLVGRPAAAASLDEGLSSCGTVEQPCTLPALTVAATAQEPAPAPARLAEGLTECGSQAEPCALEPVRVTVERATSRLAAAERHMGMSLRVKS
jgi:hypothetical protein